MTDSLLYSKVYFVELTLTYEDYSDLHISQIFADNRYDAWKQVLAIATEILDEVYTISIQECKD